MSKWYQVTCVVKLEHPRIVESGSGRKASRQTAKGYVVVVGVSASNIIQASSAAHEAALAALDGNGGRNEVEEMQIKEASAPDVREQLETEQTDSAGGKYYRSGLTFFE